MKYFKLVVLVFLSSIIILSCSGYDNISKTPPSFDNKAFFLKVGYGSRLTIKFDKNVTKKMKERFFRKISFSPIAYDVFGYDFAEYNKRIYILKKNIAKVVKETLEKEKISFSNYDLEFIDAKNYKSATKKENEKGNYSWQEKSFDLEGAINFIKINKIKFQNQGIVLVDTAPDFTHPEIKKVTKLYKGKPLYWLSRVLKSNNVFDRHGTHMSCLVTGYKHRKWGVHSYILPIIINFGNGYLSDIALGLRFYKKLEERGFISFRVVNMSFMSQDNTYVIHDAMEQMSDKLFVVAAGNKEKNTTRVLDFIDIYPAKWTMKNKITVGSLNKIGKVSSFSNISPNFVDIIAPGNDVKSCTPLKLGSLYTRLEGTSTATATVSWTANMLFSSNTKLTVDQVILSIIWGARRNKKLVLEVDQGRVLNISRALRYASFFHHIYVENN